MKILKSGIGLTLPNRDCQVVCLERVDQGSKIECEKRVIRKLDAMFQERGLDYLTGQREALVQVVNCIFHTGEGEVVAIPLIPGAGKSTLIRAFLSVMAVEFGIWSHMAQKAGGIIIVVEKTSEVRELLALCDAGGYPDIATVVESPNDFNLSLGECPAGIATCYGECLRQDCPEAAHCPLLQAARDTSRTPILILLHARYQRYLEDMRPFTQWFDIDGVEHKRTMILVDEMPNLLDENRLEIDVLNQLESKLDYLSMSYQRGVFSQKLQLFYLWSQVLRRGFIKLYARVNKMRIPHGVLRREDFDTAGLDGAALQPLREHLEEYTHSQESESIRLLDMLEGEGPFLYSRGKTFMISCPRARCIKAEHQPATFLFSGTVHLSPELCSNPAIDVLDIRMEEEFSHLKIVSLTSDSLRVSKTAFQSGKALNVLLVWLRCLLPSLTIQHEKILLVTYQEYAKILWEQLGEYQDSLIPYIDGTGTPQERLPYFGGLNGSNLYQESTCVICLGINRFEMGDYINRAFAYDFQGEFSRELELDDSKYRMEEHPSVLRMQEMTLARDIVQLLYRSALRKHSERIAVETYLINVPEGVVAHLEESFPACQIEYKQDIPEACRIESVISRRYRGKMSHGAKLLQWLYEWDGNEISLKVVREALDMTPQQYKEARKHPEVERYFREHVQKTGSGKSSCIQKKILRKDKEKSA